MTLQLIFSQCSHSEISNGADGSESEYSFFDEAVILVDPAVVTGAAPYGRCYGRYSPMKVRSGGICNIILETDSTTQFTGRSSHKRGVPTRSAVVRRPANNHCWKLSEADNGADGDRGLK
jgi:hypothetical protein